ncbi:MAG: HAD family hydrolase [Acuticoccus sp.]
MIPLNDPHTVFRRYEELRPRLPRWPGRNHTPLVVPDLWAVIDRYDAFVLDGFGVLNVGEAPIPGAVERIAALRAAGKIVIVLTNAASLPATGSVAKYRALGFDFTADEIVSSRDVALMGMAAHPAGTRWGATPGGPGSLDGLDAVALGDDPAPYGEADALLYLSAAEWDEPRQARLAAALSARPRKVVVANPDLVAPRVGYLSVEPGAFAHALLDLQPDLDVSFYGKPFGNAFEAVMARLGPAAPPPERIAMVGDTLHTDILGGAAAGWGTILITDHGIFAGLDVAPFIAASGIIPDVIATTT